MTNPRSKRAAVAAAACEGRKWYANLIAESLCTACRAAATAGFNRSQHWQRERMLQVQQRATESRTALKPHTVKQHWFPLGQCISLYLTKDLLKCSAQTPEHSSPSKKTRVSRPRCYWANWRREVLPELCLLIQISKTKFSDWWVWLEDQHMHLKMTKSIMNTSRDFVAICTSSSSMRSQRNGNSEFPLW